MRAIVRQKDKGPRSISKKNLLLMAVLRDRNDLDSMIDVDPNDLGRSLGDGYELISATIEITSEPVTIGRLERVAPKLAAKPIKLWYLERKNCATCTERYPTQTLMTHEIINNYSDTQ